MLATLAPRANAQDTIVMTGGEAVLLTEAQAKERVQSLQKQYDSVNLRRQRIGLSLSSILLIGGMITMAGGITYNRTCELEPGNPQLCREPFGTGLAVLGTFAVMGGITGLVITSVRLRKNKELKRDLRRRLRTYGGGYGP